MNARAIFDASGNFGFDHPFANYSRLAFATRAWISDDAARTLTGWARSSNAEKSLLIADLAAALTRLALNGRFAGGRPGPMTVFAGFVATDIDALFGSEDGFIEFKGSVFPKIGTALCTATAA